MLRTDEKKWYQQFWPWFLITLPTVVIIACLYTLYLAMHNPLSMVKKDYYQEGLTINKNIAELERARALGLVATLELQDSRIIHLELRSSVDFEPSTTLTLLFNHPMDDSKDLSFVLHKQAATSFTTGQLSEQQWQLMTSEKRWYVQLQPPAIDWVLQGETDYGTFNRVTLDASGD
jgi:hypothetical protein